jgi:hypothetical protein
MRQDIVLRLQREQRSDPAPQLLGAPVEEADVEVVPVPQWRLTSRLAKGCERYWSTWAYPRGRRDWPQRRGRPSARGAERTAAGAEAPRSAAASPWRGQSRERCA